MLAVQLEDSESDEASEGGCENVAGVEDADSSGNLFASVENAYHCISTPLKAYDVRRLTQQIESTGVVRRLNNTKEEAS